MPVKMFEIYRHIHGELIEITFAQDLMQNTESKIDIAIVCFQDACNVACDAVYALTHAHANIEWFLSEHPDAPLKYEAAHFGVFYATDVTLRLYAAAEHIANFIINFLNIPKDELKPYRESNKSIRMTVGKYLLAKKPDDKITLAVKNIKWNDSWDKAIKYRNDWVHNQAPHIEDTGIRRKRESILSKDGNNFSVPIGRFETPVYTREEFINKVTEATHVFVGFLAEMELILNKKIEEISFKE